MTEHVSLTERASVNMTSKGQVLIPKAIRDRIGLVPGQQVDVGINDRGEAVILPRVRSIETVEERRARRLAAMDRLAARYSTGQPTDDYMAEIRGPYDDIL